MAIQVYLDSSDYSKLTDPRGVSDDLLAVKARLISFAKSAHVEFRYSAAHIVEMAPVESIAEDAAEARVEFLAELCGKKCLRSFDHLMLAELESCGAGNASACAAYSNDGNWFPRNDDGIFSAFAEDRISPENFLPKFDHLPREERRKAEKEYFKGGKLRAKAKERILEESKGAIDAILAQLPMRECDAAVMLRYMLGDASKEQADDAFYSSLRDPRWMMRWFRHNRDSLSPIIEWLRGPAKKMQDAVASVPEASARLREAYKNVTGQESPPELSPKFRDNLKAKIFQALSAKFLGQTLSPAVDLKWNSVLNAAPGVGIAVSVMVDAIWASTSRNPRASLASDFVDAVHSMYAPYVDIFRTDAFMAPIVTSYAKPFGVSVVGKLASLIEVIESRLEQT